MQPASPVVSIVIPVFNTEAFLRESIESIRQQSLAEIEVICVDDGSTDHSAKVIEECAAKDARIRLIRTSRNRGQGAARNVGASRASGRYLYFFDSDDRLQPDALAELVNVADAEQLDVVYFDAEPFFDTPELEREKRGYRDYYRRNSQYPVATSGRELFTDMTMSDDWLPSVCVQLIRRCLLTDHNLQFPEGVFHEDQHFSCALALHADRVRHVPRAFFERRIRERSTVTSAPTARHVAGLVEAFGATMHLADQLGIPPGSPLGQAICREMDKTYEDAVVKFRRLDDDERRMFNDRPAPNFMTRDAVQRLHARVAVEETEERRSRTQTELDQANARISGYESSLWHRIVRLRRRLS